MTLKDYTSNKVQSGSTVGMYIHFPPDALHFGSISMTNIWALVFSLRKLWVNYEVHP